ncbi:hypothetical protein OUZ56_002160 [Daphnia magna]|uniref:Uncharacterized protein n=1 Tax=Daphnia magna TaxID=35525 RepID=A0ABR0A4U6_9CRUS|nr:hypothetical protein OUZ56_002160 [Daphnia magna]
MDYIDGSTSRDSIKTRISQPPDTGTPTLLQRPVDRPTLFLRLYPRDGADGAAISGVSALIFHAVPLRLVSICRGNNSTAPDAASQNLTSCCRGDNAEINEGVLSIIGSTIKECGAI